MKLHRRPQLLFQWTISAVIFFLSLHVFLDAQSTGTNSACLQAKNCGDCIITDPSCAWCAQPDFQDAENFPRCDNPDTLRERGCQELHIENPQSTMNITGKTPLSKAGDPVENLVQVYPQVVDLTMRPGEKISIDLQIRQAEDFPVDLYYLMDLSDSMSDDLVQLRSLGGILAGEMKNITNNFRLGYGAFIDKTVMPYVDIYPAKLENPCLNKRCGPAFSFHILPLTLETDRFTEEISKVNSSGNLDSPEGGMDALMQATVCTDEIGWRERARHLLVYTTDASFHIAGDGKLGGIVKPNDGKCHMDSTGFEYTMANEMDYPSISKLSQKMETLSILPIFAIGKAEVDKQDPFVFYEDLPQYFHESKAARLSADSSNIVDLIKNIYLNITSEVTVETRLGADLFEVDYVAHCLDGSITKDKQTCMGLKLGDQISFDVGITMKNLSCTVQQWNAHDSVGRPVFTENLVLNVKALCECDCSSSEQEPNSTKCNFHGTFTCGACMCNEGRSGRTCECDTVEAEGLDPSCVQPNSTVECSSRGTCVCGECECDTRGDPNRIITGEYCQCDNYLCPRSGGEVCGGSDKGTCLCDEDVGNFCGCLEGYQGSACECPTSNDTCRAPNGEICNGVRTCDCGKCQCNDPKYSGATCQICPDCAGECDINQPCVQCRAFHTGAYNKSQCKNCPHPIYVVKELRREEGHQECRFTDDDECHVIFTYEILPNGTYYIEVQEDKICPGAPEMLWVILGIIIGVFLVGLALLLIWRLLTYIHDRREFQNFEKERANATWEGGENPIYKPSTSVFKNPTYNIK
ncbi:integrin beta-C subunit precursor [Strongylocentrotus purpuratus]|uniref:Integrin beta n=1 Tax=Strongylocentrotus purpuratus TaxID=7668 RepID=P91808_STRPU|nr:integrin beta-C subunit precursor [Strongylocentrotus purpuratus]AAB39740.2 integrin beta-C subunit [Strongylocentrotus purpuratus]|eukprot:NP_999730.1 integrin beta-C subunit precursor [Strongylocentrotus purpuratus]